MSSGDGSDVQPLIRLDLADTDPQGWTAVLLGNAFIEAAPGCGPGGGDAIRVRYEGYEGGSRWVLANHLLEKPGPEMTLSYRVRFDEDFQFVLGGKLHGLGPLRPVVGGEPARPDGWSARVMFREHGVLETYLYEQDKDWMWGIGQAAEGFRFQPGRWTSVSIHVRVNSEADRAEGFTHVYVDGRRLIAHDGVRFRETLSDETLICQAMFSTFHGGNTAEWAPVDAQGRFTSIYALFSELAVYEGLHVLQPAE